MSIVRTARARPLAGTSLCSCARPLRGLRGFPPKGFAFLRRISGPDSDRAWHLGYWEAILAPRRSLREKPSPLPASSRRYAAQYFVGWIQPPCLAPCLAAHPPNRGSVFSLRSRLVPRPASRTTLVEASLSLSSAAPLAQRLSSGQPNRACLSSPLRQSSGHLADFSALSVDVERRVGDRTRDTSRNRHDFDDPR